MTWSQIERIAGMQRTVPGLPAVSRRGFLRATALAGGGVLLAAHLPSSAADAPPGKQPPSPFAFVRIDADGSVALSIPKSEMGQGIHTTLALAIAEELEADWTRVRLVGTWLDARFGDQNTGGSNSVLSMHEPMRRVGAALRTMLLHAAATRWQVPVDSLRAERGHILHADSGRRDHFGEFAADAARLDVPQNPRLKAPKDWTLLGKPHRSLEGAAIARGQMRYGIDVRLPGMCFASIERPPQFGATLVGYDREAAFTVAGVRAVLEIPPQSRPVVVHGGVAVVADTTWAAMQGRRALSVRWSDGPHADETSEAYLRTMRAAVATAGKRELNRIGDPDATLAAADSVHSAEFLVPFLAHASMEPQNCTAHWHDGRMTLWSPTQFPGWAQNATARALGIDMAQVDVHILTMGGAFGRRINPDFSVEAALLARQLDHPVSVVWTREDDMTHDFYRPCAVHRLDACLDANGHPAALRHRLCDAAIDATYGGSGADCAMEASGIGDTFYRVPARSSEFTLLESGVPRGWWRGVHTTHTTFAIEAFIDELASAAGADPVAYRLALIDAIPVTVPRGEPEGFEFDAGRMRTCLQAGAERFGWGAELPAGHAAGIACVFTHRSYVTLALEASLDAGKLVLHRIVCTVDCGTVLNPDSARAQVEGSIVQGLSAALHEQITVDAGGVKQRNFHEYRLLRMPEAPRRIDVHFLDRPEARISGLGEPALPVVAPALANALFRLTGRRHRTLPFALG